MAGEEDQDAAALVIQRYFRGSKLRRQIYNTMKTSHNREELLSQNAKGNIGPGASKRQTAPLENTSSTFNCFVDESEIVKNSIV